VNEPSSSGSDAPFSRLSSEEKGRRSASFGEAATQYEKFRPGPPVEAVDWMLQSRPGSVVDLGAGTGAMTKLLLERADHVIAVEPDERMLEMLALNLPHVTAVTGRGEAIPLPDASVDAVLASSSWHWMDPEQTLREVARVLAPGGVLGAVWSGPDPEGPFVAQAQALLSQRADGESTAAAPAEGAGEVGLASAVIDPDLPPPVLNIPADSPFAQPEHHVITWDVALNADELIGLLGTFSWIITMSEAQRSRVFAEARRLLKDALGIAGDVTVDLQYRAEAWRARLAN
jgi:SAM-dependent methyltransferase